MVILYFDILKVCFILLNICSLKKWLIVIQQASASDWLLAYKHHKKCMETYLCSFDQSQNDHWYILVHPVGYLFFGNTLQCLFFSKSPSFSTSKIEYYTNRSTMGLKNKQKQKHKQNKNSMGYFCELILSLSCIPRWNNCCVAFAAVRESDTFCCCRCI